MTSSLNTALFLFLWTSSSLKLCRCGSSIADCDFTESYDAVVMVSVKEPVYVTKYKWCWEVPPRCPDNKLEYRTVLKNITVPKTRIVKRCCKYQIQLYDYCVPKCDEDQCPNIQCAPGTDKCKCKPGFTGHLCSQKCNVGYWGVACKNTCNKSCPDCDHRTGCCRTPINDDRVTAAGLTFCATGKVAPQTSFPLNDTELNGDNEKKHTTRPHVQISQTVTLEPVTLELEVTEMEIKPNSSGTIIETRKPIALVIKNQSIPEDIVVYESTSSSSSSSSLSPSSLPSPPPPNRLQNDGTGFVHTVTKVEVTVYKYDELVKKLIWISAMTVIAIAMVFIIMFVIFLNCYGVTKADDRSQNRQSMSVATINKFNDACISTQNLGHVPPDRYTKAPALCTPTNDGLPIHPDIFCPVFSAPHYTDGMSIYDSPQPLYEILC